jgi:hypothetical protein
MQSGRPLERSRVEFMPLAWQDGRVVAIRDFRYVPYIVTEADFVDL